jgi:hypothetical protein
MSFDFNDAGEQRTFEVIPAGTIATLRMKIRPGARSASNQVLSFLCAGFDLVKQAMAAHDAGGTLTQPQPELNNVLGFEMNPPTARPAKSCPRVRRTKMTRKAYVNDELIGTTEFDIRELDALKPED